jgi:DNA-3-methyladenine glycosylase I
MNEKVRCKWCTEDRLYLQYHDREWGVPGHNDVKLFEFLILEGAQAGLNWLTILKKRAAYRKAFDNFDINKIARYNERKIQLLLRNPGIVRNRLKIRSTVQNARAFIKVRKEFGTFDRYLWSFVDGRPIRNRWKTIDELPAKTEISDTISDELKQRGFSFVGSIICYAYMQAVGMANDHTMDCFRYFEVQKI